MIHYVSSRSYASLLHDDLPMNSVEIKALFDDWTAHTVDRERGEESPALKLNEIVNEREIEKPSAKDASDALMATLRELYEDTGTTLGKKRTRGFDAHAWKTLLTPQDGNEKELRKYAANLNMFLGRVRDDIDTGTDPACIHVFLDSILAGGYSALEGIGKGAGDALHYRGARPMRILLMMQGALRLRSEYSRNLGLSDLLKVFEEQFVVIKIQDCALALASAHGNARDCMELEMYLLGMLENKFPLPFKAPVPYLHRSSAKISKDELTEIQDEIKSSMHGEQFIHYLSRNDNWRDLCAHALQEQIAALDVEFQRRCRDEETLHQTGVASAEKTRTELVFMLEETRGLTYMPDENKEMLADSIRSKLNEVDADLKSTELEKSHRLSSLMKQRDAALESLYLDETRFVVAKRRSPSTLTADDLFDY